MIETIKKYLKKYMGCPVAVLGFIVGISAFSLAAALIAEHVFGLAPCILCLYQRVPFVIAIFLGLAGLGLIKTGKEQSLLIVGLSGLTFLANSVIAFYHSGVERHWWESFIEGCAIPDLGDDPAAMLEALKNAPAVRCNEIPWADPIFGLSMANYNVMLCLGMAALCFTSAWMIKQRR